MSCDGWKSVAGGALMLFAAHAAFGQSMVKVTTHIELEQDEAGTQVRARNSGWAKVEMLDPGDDGERLEISARILEYRKRDCTVPPDDVAGCFSAVFVNMAEGITSVSCRGSYSGHCRAGYASRLFSSFAAQSPSAYSGCQSLPCPGID